MEQSLPLNLHFNIDLDDLCDVYVCISVEAALAEEMTGHTDKRNA